MYVDGDYLFHSIDNAISIVTLLKDIGEHSKFCQPYFIIGKDFDMSAAQAVNSIIDCTWVYTISPNNVTDVNNFYREFDKAFLTIFPRFVEEFNLLLREDQRFNLKDSDSLNSELRIFALIRLGIKDSSKIAEFMNYTAVTVYTYRTKVKSKAINKDTFDQDVLNIETNIIKNLANHEYKEM